MAFATAIREQKLWRFTSVELGIAALQVLLSIGLAVFLRSYWALLWAMLVSAVAKAALSYVAFPGSRRRWRFSLERSRDLWAFSRSIAPASILTLLMLQSDKLILARLLPLHLFGLYAIAATLASAPWGLAQSYAQKILYPVLAATERENPAQLREEYYRRRRLPLFAYHLVVGGLVGGAPLLVAVLYDPRYQGVAPLLQILTISSAMHFLNTNADQVMVAVGKPRVMLYGMIGRVVWLTVGGVIALAADHPMLLIIAFGLVEVVVAPMYWLLLARERIFDMRQEVLAVAVLVAGIFSGWAVTAGVRLVVPGIFS
jgi:O-antigen/teichoic acid export membrane protein